MGGGGGCWQTLSPKPSTPQLLNPKPEALSSAAHAQVPSHGTEGTFSFSQTVIYEGSFKGIYKGAFTGIYKGAFISFYKGAFKGIYEGSFQWTYEGSFEGIYKASFKRIY